MLNLPPLIDINKFYFNKKFDEAGFIEYAYSKFKEDFIINSTMFQGNIVFVQPKVLDCFNCGFNCNNKFDCKNCPWANKEDIFQHITSDKDVNLQLSREYKRTIKGKRLHTRTPGIFSKERTQRIRWIKYIIENSNNGNILIDSITDTNNKREEKIRLFHKSSDFLVILSKTKTKDGKYLFYLNSAYNNPPRSFLRCFKYERGTPQVPQ